MNTTAPQHFLGLASNHPLSQRSSTYLFTASTKSLSAQLSSALIVNDKLTPLEISTILVVLEDCINKATILESILPRGNINYKETGSIDKILGSQLKGIIETQDNLNSELERLQIGRDSGKNLKPQLKDIFSSLGSRQVFPDESLNRSAINTQNDQSKMVKDCQNFLIVLENLYEELNDKGTYTCLKEYVKEAKKEKDEMRNLIDSEVNSRDKVKKIKKDITESKQSYENEVQECRKIIAHLKDQIQEHKSKFSLELKYTKKLAQLEVSIAQKQFSNEEKEKKSQIDKYAHTLESNKRAHEDVERFLKEYQQKHQDIQLYWSKKYDNDIEQKTEELADIESKLAGCLSKIKEETLKYDEHKRVIEEDKAYREKIRLAEERDIKELRATLLLQAWWQRMMFKKQLGPYKPKKKCKKANKKKAAKKTKK